MKKLYIPYFVLGLLSLVGMSSCQGFFQTESTDVLFDSKNDLKTPTDKMYSVIGIMNQMQKIADRTVLLGEIRSDLVSLTQSATTDLQDLANFEATTANRYNQPSDYYSIINNCNFFLAKVDTSLRLRNVKVFEGEFAAVKAYRAWTYLQLAQIYGSVPFITEPILTEKDTKKNFEMKNVKQISAYFINDLLPEINTPLPTYGNIGGLASANFYIPIRLLLGDLCLWSERYLEAATYYHNYLTINRLPIGVSNVFWMNSTIEFLNSPADLYRSLFPNSLSEVISYIPMESNTIDGVVSNLRNVFNSNASNYNYNMVTYSPSLKNLSKSQSNCKVYVNQTLGTRDTLYAPPTNADNDLYVGDLRLSSIYTVRNVTPTSDQYSDESVTNAKFGRHINLYRRSLIYLRLAEALNRAGLPSTAFVTLKYGLTQESAMKYIDSTEYRKATSLGVLIWSPEVFIPRTISSTANSVSISGTTMGLHSKGSGDADANKYYVLPNGLTQSQKIEYVEDLISDEMALETAFEGYRMSDLIRIALRRNDNTYLAKKIASRNGAEGTAGYNAALYSKLTDSKNWYLPLK